MLRWVILALLFAPPSWSIPTMGPACVYGGTCGPTAYSRAIAAASASGVVATPSTPYDLSSHSIPFTVTWPAEPVDADTICAATNASEFSTCLGTSNRHITLAAGTYNGVFFVGGTDQWIDMDNGAEITGTLLIQGSVSQARTKISGGTLTDSLNIQTQGGNDVLFDNVVITDTENTMLGYGGPPARVAFVNSTIRSADFGIYVSGGAGVSDTDLIFAGNCITSSTDSSDDPDSPFRIESADRIVIADNWLSSEHASGVNSAVRLHSLVNDVYVGGNVMSGSLNNAVKFEHNAYAPDPQFGSMTNLNVVNNDYYLTPADSGHIEISLVETSPYTFTGGSVVGNTLHMDTAGTDGWVIAGGGTFAGSPVISGNTRIDYSTPPTCASSGYGADH